MKICIVTGGSGGHIFPAITYADYVKNNTNHEIFFIGNDHIMESRIVPEAGYDFYPIHNEGLQGSLLDKIKAMFSQFGAVFQARKHLINLQPDLVFSFGGYVSVPVGLAAKSLKIPLVIHEQNAYPGKANKLLAKGSKAVITCYPESFSDMKQTHYLGNPRASLSLETIDSKAEFERLGLKDLPTVLIVMGSQGSSAMNPVFEDVVHNFTSKDYQIIIATGPYHIEDFKNKFPQLPKNIILSGFVDQKALLPKLDLIVARAGASTIAEIQSFGVPSILIPSPHVAYNHQYFNAKSLLDKEACVLLAEENLVGKKLLSEIEKLMKNDEKRQSLALHVKQMAKPKAVSDIHEVIEEVLSR